MRPWQPQFALTMLMLAWNGIVPRAVGEALDPVQDALDVLQSIGIDGICHPASSDFVPLIPRCAEDWTDVPMEPSWRRRLVSEEIMRRRAEAWFCTYNAVGAVVCVMFVALISCMFLGFLTLDPLDLQIKMRASYDEEERMHAATLLPIVEQHHRLLVTLLILNAIAYECLPLFLDNLLPSWAAILMSVSFLLIFGEIIPSAIFTGPDQLRLAGYLAPLVNFAMCALYPLANPLTRLLDYLVPHDKDVDDTYDRSELAALVRIQLEEREAKERGVTTATRKPRVINGGNSPSAARAHPIPRHSDAQSWRALKREIMEAAASGMRSRSNSFSNVDNALSLEQSTPPIHKIEVQMVEGALEMKTKVALDIYTPMRRMFSIPSDMILNKDNVSYIYSEAFSRIPVYDPDPERGDHQCALRGVLMARLLILIDWDDERKVSTLPLQIPPCVSPKTNLLDLLRILQRGKSLMVFVCARPDVANRALEAGKALPVESGFMGLITLEDVLESLLQDRIYDEEDVQERELASARLTQWATSVLQRFAIKNKVKSNVPRGSGGTPDTKRSVPLPTLRSEREPMNGRQQSSRSESTPLLGNS